MQMARNLGCYILAGLCSIIAGVGCREARNDVGPIQERALVNADAAKYLIRAQDAFDKANYTSSLALLDSAEQHAVTSNPAFLADVSFLRGRVYGGVRRYEEAQSAYERVLQLKPAYQGAWLNLGNIAFWQGDFQGAVRYYRHEQDTNPGAQPLIYMGRAYNALDRADSAKYAYEQAISTDPEFADAYALLGQTYDQAGEPDKALEYARKALERKPENLGYRFLVGRMLLRTEQPEQARGYLAAVVSQQPGNFNAQYSLGQALVRLGRVEEGNVHLVVADSLRKLNTELAAWEIRTHTSPDNPAVWATYGYALRQAGHMEEALDAFQTALFLNPENVDVRFELANLYLHTGDGPNALAEYETILQQDSTYADAWFNAGVVLARMGQTDAARRAWEATLRQNPEYSEAKEYLSRPASNR